MKVVLNDAKQLTTLGALAPGVVFKFVDREHGLQLCMKTASGTFVELSGGYDVYDADLYDHAEVVVYDATLQVSL